MQVQHRLIIRHPKDATLLADDRDGTCRLPSVVAGDRHTAEVDYLNTAALEQFGVTTTVLRSLSHSDDGEPMVRVHEMQAHNVGDAQTAGVRWVAPDPRLFDAGDRSAVTHWRTSPAATDGPDWTQPRWFETARAWIVQALDEAGLGPVHTIEQLRVWASTVLRVRAAGGEYYFKALPRSGSHEYAVTQYLGEHFADSVPRIVKCEPRRGWLLLTACAGHKLEEVIDPALWERAAQRYARLQADCTVHVPALRALGCPVHDLESLARRMEPLCHDAGALRIGHANGLAGAEVERLRQLLPTLRRQCKELAACGVALTLEHGDLWPGNIFVDAVDCRIIDWEDVIIAHPFFSLAPLGVGLRNNPAYSPELLQRVESAYLSAFAGTGSKARLRSALHLAAPLGFFNMAIHYRHQRPSVVALHPWMRDLVPETLRLALASV